MDEFQKLLTDDLYEYKLYEIRIKKIPIKQYGDSDIVWRAKDIGDLLGYKSVYHILSKWISYEWGSKYVTRIIAPCGMYDVNKAQFFLTLKGIRRLIRYTNSGLKTPAVNIHVMKYFDKLNTDKIYEDCRSVLETKK